MNHQIVSSVAALRGFDASTYLVELAKDSRDQLGDSRVNMHRALNGRVRQIRVHDIDYGMNRLITVKAQYGSAENLVCVTVDNDFHESLRLSKFTCAANARHLPFSDAHVETCFARGPFRQADTTERRIDENAVAFNPIRYESAVIREKICRHDLEIVVCGMCKSAAPINLTQRPNALLSGSQLLIDSDQPLSISLNACCREP